MVRTWATRPAAPYPRPVQSFELGKDCYAAGNKALRAYGESAVLNHSEQDKAIIRG